MAYQHWTVAGCSRGHQNDGENIRAHGLCASFDGLVLAVKGNGGYLVRKGDTELFSGMAETLEVAQDLCELAAGLWLALRDRSAAVERRRWQDAGDRLSDRISGLLREVKVVE
jgi:hypothetical protein